MNRQIQWAESLLTWFFVNKRELPWRENKDPYRIWVSEVMLQQTKVEAVKPYFYSWMEKFPTVRDLAVASEEEVLKAWQGLGYYQRAKNLHAAVQEICQSYGGKVPEDKKIFQSLRGVGEYTAGAVTSIAYGKAEPAVDGNVLRIFARLYCIEQDILKVKTKKEITALVKEQMPGQGAGDFNEALMDLGATICIPKAPKCSVCPLQYCCEAYRLGKEKELPIRKKKGEVPLYHVTVGFVKSPKGYLVHRRPDTGLLSSMWEFPAVFSDTKEEGLKPLQAYLQDIGIKETVLDRPVLTIRHVFSHQKWQMKGYFFSSEGKEIEEESWRWLKEDEFSSLPWAGPFGKLAGKVKDCE